MSSYLVGQTYLTKLLTDILGDALKKFATLREISFIFNFLFDFTIQKMTSSINQINHESIGGVLGIRT